MGDYDEFEETQASSRSGRVNAAGDKLVLLVLAPGGILEFDLPAAGTRVVGRSPSATIHVDHHSISRQHAELAVGPQGWMLRDLGSLNGTFVNDVRIGEAPSPIKPGDQLRFGNVAAQFHVTRMSTVHSAKAVPPEDFVDEVRKEAERAMRFGRSCGVIAIETVQGESSAPKDGGQSIVLRSLRVLDLVCARGRGRFDVLVPECNKDEALDVAQRVSTALAARHIGARIGVAVFPGDAPSGESLVLAAQLAMRAVADAGVGAARDAARVLQIAGREVVVADPVMVRLFGMIERVAGGLMPVLVTGETGSGKEIVAETLHALGPRARASLVRINCAAVPENLLESELFGHERGAFSGAVAAKPGLFEQADGGTLFLDEIGEMPLTLQAKLLRVLEDHRVRRVGALKDTHIDVRVVAATHRDLSRAVSEGRFREDLFYRLNAILLTVPPLRNRRREVVLLAERFIAEHTAGRAPLTLGAGVVEALERYAWPGNLRELRNTIARAVALCDGDEITPQHLPEHLAHDTDQGADGGIASSDWIGAPSARDKTGQIVVDQPHEPHNVAMKQLERDRIVAALDACQGNQTKAAQLLQMPRRTLVYKLTALGIDGRRGRRSER